MYFLDWGVCFPDKSSVPILPTPYGGFLSCFFSFSSLRNPEDKNCIHSIITAFHVTGNGKVSVGSHYPRERGGLRVGWVWEERAWMPLSILTQIPQDTKQGSLAIQKTCSGRQVFTVRLEGSVQDRSFFFPFSRQHLLPHPSVTAAELPSHEGI